MLIMKMLKEFKEFAMRGNVVDLAVGVIIGGAFGKIVSSVVNDIIMPPIGLLISGVKFTDIKIKISDAVLDAAGAVTKEAITINIGNFIQTVIDFTLVAMAIFFMIKLMNNLNKKKADPDPAPATPPPPSKEESLLTEIRDILKSKSN
jgi:large conductance mechanosensitive channel